MNETELERVCTELNSAVTGQQIGKIFPLSRFETAIDFRLPSSLFLFISIEPSQPRIHLIKRRLKDLEKLTVNPSPFLLYIRKRLSGAVVRNVTKFPDERVVRIRLSAETETGEMNDFSLIAQLTGRSANIFLLDANDFVLESMRLNTGRGQVSGQLYEHPPRPSGAREQFTKTEIEVPENSGSMSAVLDEYYLEKAVEKRFQSRAAAARTKLNAEIKKRETLRTKLNQDRENHGHAEKWKRMGDLLLANAANARREGDKIFVTDFFEDTTPEISIDIDENLSITQAAEKFFKRYAKARNAAGEIAKRLETVEKELARLERERTELEAAIERRDDLFFEEPLAARTIVREKKTAVAFNGARRFLSSDGFEILVGKKAKDNDHLTFRIAGSLDMWLHAADYPGSHVVIRNPSRKEVPQKTLLEGAQLAAFYSDAGQQKKAAVHYTQKKFVNKPRGASPGLVSLASFKTILVEPRIPDSA